jgi:hypothetical protein
VPIPHPVGLARPDQAALDAVGAQDVRIGRGQVVPVAENLPTDCFT